MELSQTELQKSWGSGKNIRSLLLDMFSNPFIFANLKSEKKSLIFISLTMSEIEHLHFLYCDPSILVNLKKCFSLGWFFFF